MKEFSEYSDQARLWIYAFREPLTAENRGLVTEALADFFPHWVTHGTPVRARYQIVEDRFLLLVADSPGGISGCSIDSSVAVFKALRDRWGLDGLDRSLVFYRDQDGQIQAHPFLRFQDLVSRRQISGSTPVFDTTLTTLGELRTQGLEQPFGESWHARRFSA